MKHPLGFLVEFLEDALRPHLPPPPVPPSPARFPFLQLVENALFDRFVEHYEDVTVRRSELDARIDILATCRACGGRPFFLARIDEREIVMAGTPPAYLYRSAVERMITHYKVHHPTWVPR